MGRGIKLSDKQFDQLDHLRFSTSSADIIKSAGEPNFCTTLRALVSSPEGAADQSTSGSRGDARTRNER